MGKKKETPNDRIKILRKALKMDQAKFASKIGLSASAMSRIEIGETTLTEHKLLLICLPGHFIENQTINDDWLRTGRGDMFLSPPKIYDDDGKELAPDEAELIRVYRELFTSNKKMIRAEVKKIMAIQEATKEGLGIPSDDAVKG